MDTNTKTLIQDLMATASRLTEDADETLDDGVSLASSLVEFADELLAEAAHEDTDMGLAEAMLAFADQLSVAKEKDLGHGMPSAIPEMHAKPKHGELVDAQGPHRLEIKFLRGGTELQGVSAQLPSAQAARDLAKNYIEKNKLSSYLEAAKGWSEIRIAIKPSKSRH